MTRNLKLFVGAALIFYLIGAVNDAAGMYVLAAAALGVVLTAYFLTRLHIRGVRPEIELSAPRTRAKSGLDAILKIHNTGAIRRTGMRTQLTVKNETVRAGSYNTDVELPALPPRSVTELQVPLECPIRGKHSIADIEVTAIDPLDVYHRSRTFEGDAMFLGLPRIHVGAGISRERLLSPRGKRAMHLVQDTESEFEGIRPHTPDDDLRMVHWKATAHTDELMVRQYSDHHSPRITVWLDACAANHPYQGEDSPTEIAVSLVASLLENLVSQTQLVSLASQAFPPNLSLPSHGEAFLDRAIMALAEFRPVAGPRFAAFCRRRAHATPDAGNIFVVTPGVEPDLVEALGVANTRATHVTAILVAGEEGGGNSASSSSSSLERGSAVDHEQLAGMLRAAGIECTILDAFEDIPEAFARIAEPASAVSKKL